VRFRGFSGTIPAMNAPSRFTLTLSALALTLDSTSRAGPQEPPPEAEPARGLRVRAQGAFEGMTLFSPLLSHDVFLVDMEGEVAHTWKTDLPPAGSVYLLDDGHLLRSGRVEDNPMFRGGGIGGRIQEVDWDGKLVWDFPLADEYQTQHHDLEPLPNGNVLAIVWEHRFADDAREWGRDAEALGERGLWPDAVLEIRPERPGGGEVVWEWHVWDHVIQDRDPDGPNYGSVPDHPERVDINADHRDRPPISAAERERLEQLARDMRAVGYTGGDDDEDGDEDEDEEGAGDGAGAAPAPRRRGADWLHTNAVDYHPGHDLIALSVPNVNEIWVIDHSTTTDQAAGERRGRFGRGGGLLWRWGNPRTYGAGGDGDRRLFYQHDAQWVLDAAADELRLTVFNNGGGRPDGDWSSVEELLLPFDPERGFLREEGAAFGPSQPAWSYAAKGELYSGFISGAQRLPNGNTLVCEGDKGRVLEVTRDGRIVWEYWNPFGGEIATTQVGGNAPPKALFRATRIPSDHPGLAGRGLE